MGNSESNAAIETKQETDDRCDSTLQCKCVERIIMVLKFYQMINENSIINDKHNELILEYFNKYEYLVNDYHHIIVDHLNSSTTCTNNYQFSLLHNEIAKHIKCDVIKCQQYKRYSRNRENVEKATNKIKDENVLFYIDLLDNIHCYFVHSYHIGFRIKHNIKNESKQELQDIDSKQLYYDSQMEQLKAYLSNKRNKLVKIRGLNRIINNKFLTKITSNDENVQDIKNEHDDINTDIDQKISMNTKPKNQYSFGNRYTYWDFYKKRKYSYALYIREKYSNLKEELTNNNIFKIDVAKYCYAFIKAKKMVYSSTFLKSMTSKDYLNYGVGSGVPVKMENLMAIICYTDYDELSYHFSTTFRKLNSSDTINTLKLRNREFYHWSKILRETVECYGTEIWKSKPKIFYHGVSMVYFNSFVAEFNCPTSTTSQIEVSAVFADENGIILELEQYVGFGGYNLKYFDCALLSCYGNESERLFFGGFQPLQFRSIRLIAKNENYQRFITALTLFHDIIYGKEIKYDVKKSDCKIIFALIKQELNEKNNRFPQYINQCFSQFCKDKTETIIDVTLMKTQYSKFCKYFIHSECDNLILFDYICEIFKNCGTITCRIPGNITSKYLDLLLNIVSFLSTTKLETIEIFWDLNGRLDCNEFKQYAILFAQQKWSIVRQVGIASNYTSGLSLARHLIYGSK